MANGDEFLDEPDLHRPHGVNAAARADHPHGVAIADDPRETLRAAIDQRHAPLPVERSELGIFGCDAKVAPERDTSQVGDHMVTATSAHLDRAIVYLRIDGETIETTPNHSFLTDNGWVEAGLLRPGTRVQKLDGLFGTVDGFRTELRPAIMWDLTVVGVHTFAVGTGGYVVHNADCDFWAHANGIMPLGPSKPAVTDPKLSNIVGNLYKPGAQIGNRGTADAIRYTKLTGEPVGGGAGDHLIKGEESISALRNWLGSNSNASSEDISTAQWLLDDLLDAMSR